MLTLIADSGSTKTEWALLQRNGHHIATYKTQGINPMHLDDEEIVKRIQPILKQVSSQIKADTLFSQQPVSPSSDFQIHFYGSGVTAQQEQRMTQLLTQSFDPMLATVQYQLSTIESYSDILAAARATCQRHEGIVAILGTGSNSCLYNGKDIIQQTPSLGYILGDEGGAVHMGKILINHIYKKQYADDIQQAFEQYTNEDIHTIIEKVYRHPMPNTFIASLTPFIKGYREQFPVLNDIITQSFNDFICRNLLPYFSIARPDIPVHAVGSIAKVFQQQWTAALRKFNLNVGNICQAPMQGLIRYHSDK